MFVKLDAADGSWVWGEYLGYDKEELGRKIVAYSDGYVYGLGDTISTDYTNGGSDIYLMRMSQDGVKSYVKNFGSTNAEKGRDMKITGTSIFILGTSDSLEFALSFEDLIVLSLDTSSATLNWVKALGTGHTVGEFGMGLTLDKSGNVYGLGKISALDYSNGDTDFFFFSIYADGTTNFVEHFGTDN